MRPFAPVLRLSRLRTTWTLSTRHFGNTGFQTFTQAALPLLWGMYREATDRTQHLRAKAISEARRGIDDWVRQHAEKGNKRLHAWVRGDTPSMVEFQVDGNATTDPALILASSVVSGLNSGHRGEIVTTTFAPSSLCVEQPKIRNRCLPSQPPCWTQPSVLRVDAQVKGVTCWGHPTSSPSLTKAGETFDLLNQVEQACTWPWQLLSTSIMLKPNPTIQTDRWDCFQ